MDLGDHFSCRNIANMNASIKFYTKLGFAIVDDHRDERWAKIRYGRCAGYLFKGHIDRSPMDFRGDNVESVYV